MPLNIVKSNNKFIVAAAGSGKTTSLVQEAIQQNEGRVLITTYTQANELEIRKKIIKSNNCIPKNVTVQTWFSFLLKHGVRPFQPTLYDKKIKGLLLVNSQSGIKAFRNQCQDCKENKVVKASCTKCKNPIYFGEEKELEKHYFSPHKKIYSDKLSKFVFRCNEKSNGDVIDRISRIYSHIFVDEIQDLAGYDLDLLKLFLKTKSRVLLVGDPRQGTYSTNSTAKNKKFRKSQVVSFFDDDKLDITKDDTSLIKNYRCNPQICALSNKLFPNYSQTTSGNNDTTGHDGVFFIKTSDASEYLKQFTPIQLRDTIRTGVNNNFPVMNFGESKGLTFDRVLIYPTKPIIDWLKDNSKELADTSRSKFYVALTRAKYSVGIVFDYGSNTNVEGITNFQFENNV